MALVLGLPSAAARAGTFDVKAPGIEKGESELTVNTAFRNGPSPLGDNLRGAIEVSASHAYAEWLKLGVKANMEQAIGESWTLATTGVEAQLSFGKLAPMIAWGWYTGIDVRVDRMASHAVAFGPILQFGNEKLALTFNTFLAKSFGPNRDEGVAFVYAMGLKGEVREGLALGIEAHGTIPDLGHGTPVDRQEHRVGPVVYIERELVAKREGRNATKLQLEIGAFVGLTDATPDWTGKIKAGIVW